MRIFYTLSIILLFSFAAESQDRAPSAPDRQPVATVVRFYPNPAVSYITFEFKTAPDKDLSLQIYNFLGKKVYEGNNLNEKTVIDLSDFYRGMYIFQLRDHTGRVLNSGKFQVSR